MKHSKGCHVEYKIPYGYRQNSVAYRCESGTITEVLPKCKAYHVLPDGYDTSVFVPEHNIVSVFTPDKRPPSRTL